MSPARGKESSPAGAKPPAEDSPLGEWLAATLVLASFVVLAITQALAR